MKEICDLQSDNIVCQILCLQVIGIKSWEENFYRLLEHASCRIPEESIRGFDPYDLWFAICGFEVFCRLMPYLIKEEIGLDMRKN